MNLQRSPARKLDYVPPPIDGEAPTRSRPPCAHAGQCRRLPSHDVRLGQPQSKGRVKDEHALLAKAYTRVKCRQTLGYARELLEGNGILRDNHIDRFVANAHAINPYKVARKMITLILGKAIAGLGVFV